MAYTLEEFAGLDLSTRVQSLGACSVCSHDIAEVHPDDVAQVDGRPAHPDCYYDGLGSLMEQHPPGLPRVR